MGTGNMNEISFYGVPVLYTLIQWGAARFFLPKSNISGICGVALVAVCIWVLFHLFIVPDFGNILLFKVVLMPQSVKCPLANLNIAEPKCEEGDIDGWSLWHFSDHFVMGFLYPHLSCEAYFVLFQSFLCELGEFVGGERARFVVDPGVNLLGYGIGCLANSLFTAAALSLADTRDSVKSEAHMQGLPISHLLRALKSLENLEMGSTTNKSGGVAYCHIPLPGVPLQGIEGHDGCSIDITMSCKPGGDSGEADKAGAAADV